MDHTLLNLCLQFKTRVCSELRAMSPLSRETLKGDYLFVIDGLPLFIMLVDDHGAWSVLLKPKSQTIFSQNPSISHKCPINIQANQIDLFDIEIDTSCPFLINPEQIFNIIESSARCQIKTDGNTLKRILLGNLKAKVAFITKRVKISGDFPAFLKIISYLKTKGLKPNASPQSLHS